MCSFSGRIGVAVLATAALLLAGCSTSAASFVEDQPGYAVTKGRILHVADFHADSMTPLADGVALRLSRPGQVAIRFADERDQVISLGAGAIVVCSGDSDYVLVAGDGGAAEASAEPKATGEPQ